MYLRVASFPLCFPVFIPWSTSKSSLIHAERRMPLPCVSVSSPCSSWIPLHELGAFSEIALAAPSFRAPAHTCDQQLQPSFLPIWGLTASNSLVTDSFYGNLQKPSPLALQSLFPLKAKLFPSSLPPPSSSLPTLTCKLH